MADTTLKTRIKLRSDTLTNWETENPILLQGEVAVVLYTSGTDAQFTGKAKIKIGDNIHTFKELPFIGGDDSRVFETTVESGTDIQTAIATAINGETPNLDDICIIKTKIGDTEKVKYTSFVYSTEGWKAMNGDYSANTVYFDEDITLAGSYTSVGNVKLSDGTLATKGKSLSEVMTQIFTKELQPTKTEPSINLTVNLAGKSYEIGTTISPTYEVSLNTGSYTYGPNPTGVSITSWAIIDSAKTTTYSTTSGSFSNITLTESNTPYTITATANYSAGSKAVTNLGNSTNIQIAAGTKNKTCSQITCYRSWFIGGLNSDSSTELTSSIIRGLKSVTSLKSYATKASDFNAGNIKRFIIAVPASENKTLNQVLLTSASNADITSQFVKQTSTVNVEGVNGYTAVAYTVWVYEPALLDGSEAYAITVA